MIPALLAACVSSPSVANCATKTLSVGTHKVVAADGRHRIPFDASVNSPHTATHEAFAEIYIGSASCEKTSPRMQFSLFPGASHDFGNDELEPNTALCVRVSRGTITITLNPATINNEIAWESQVTALHSLAPLCVVRATQLRCKPVTLQNATYRIVSAVGDDVQAGVVFIGGYYRPGANGVIKTRTDLSRPAGTVHLFTSDRSCDQIDPKMKMHASLLDQRLHAGGQMADNAIVNAGSSLCVSVTGTITFVAP